MLPETSRRVVFYLSMALHLCKEDLAIGAGPKKGVLCRGPQPRVRIQNAEESEGAPSPALRRTTGLGDAIR